MKKQLLSSVLLMVMLMLGGCSTNSIIQSSYYNGKSIPDKVLAVAKFTPVILIPDDVVDDLGKGVAQDVFLDYFSKEFDGTLQKGSTFHSVSYLSKEPVSSLIDTTVDYQKGEQLRFKIPAQSEIVRYDSLTPDFIIFFTEFTVTRGAVQSGTYVPNGHGGGSYTGGSFGDLSFVATFAIWDNNERRFVSYGRASSKSTLLFGAMTKGDWQNCSRDLAHEIVKGTPFTKPR